MDAFGITLNVDGAMLLDYIIYGLILVALVAVLTGGILLWPKGPDERLWGAGPGGAEGDENDAGDALPSGWVYGDDHRGKGVPSEQVAALGGLTTAAIIALLWTMTQSGAGGGYSLVGALVRVVPLAGIYAGLLLGLVVKPGGAVQKETQIKPEHDWTTVQRDLEVRRRRRRWIKRGSGEE